MAGGNPLECFDWGKPLATLLGARGMAPEDVRAFLNPTSAKLHPAGLLPDVEKATERLAKAVKEGESILVYADYDVDGVVGGLIAYGGLKELGAKCKLFLPERKPHGYGLNIDILRKAVVDGVDVLLSVDCGISNVAEADFLAQAGIDLIVSDHHSPPPELPKAYALVDPKLPGSKYPYKDLCGAVVGAKLIASVYDKLGLNGDDFLQRNLALLALATVTDVCPVDGENRSIVARGLSAFAEGAPPGLIELARCAGQDPAKFSVFSFGFILGPRLNAAGRLDSPKLAAALITAKDEKKISELASALENLNRQRKTIVKRCAEQASSRVDAGECPGPIIALHHSSWHEGVIGLIASNLAGAYKRPALVATDTENGFCKGSGRTSGTFDLLDALRAADGKLAGYGGHSAAVGFKLLKDDFPQFVEDLESSDSCKFNDERFTPVLNIDGTLTINDLSENDVEELQLTQPWGRGNEAPAFLLEGIDIIECDTMGDGTHIRLKLRQGGKSINAVGFGFNAGGLFLTQVTGKADVAAVPEINEFRGNRDVRLRLKDIRFI